VLLFCLILHNPFFLLTHQLDGFAYRALARNRATVGASELQPFCPVHNPNVQPEFAVDQHGVGVAVPAEESAYRVFQRQDLSLLPELISSIWFRPPPIL
jgi:hypothetical protein